MFKDLEGSGSGVSWGSSGETEENHEKPVPPEHNCSVTTTLTCSGNADRQANYCSGVRIHRWEMRHQIIHRAVRCPYLCACACVCVCVCEIKRLNLSLHWVSSMRDYPDTYRVLRELPSASTLPAILAQSSYKTFTPQSK